MKADLGLDDNKKAVRLFKFRPTSDPFQIELKNTIENIVNSEAIHVHSDKTGNLYQMDAETHQDFIRKNLTSAYRKTDLQALIAIQNVSIGNSACLILKQPCFCVVILGLRRTGYQ